MNENDTAEILGTYREERKVGEFNARRTNQNKEKQKNILRK